MRLIRHPHGRYRHALLPILALLALLVSGCGGDRAAESDATADTTVQSGPTEAVLRPVGDGEETGTVRVDASGSAELKIDLRGLQPLPQGGQYVLWMTRSRNDMVLVFSHSGDSSGRISELTPVNPLRIEEIEDGRKTDFLVTSTQSERQSAELLGKAAPTFDPPVIGTPVLRGPFTGSLVGVKENE
jgi:hypothetical protein